MNTPISPRMSTWDIPHVPPAADPPSAEDSTQGQESQAGIGETVSQAEDSLAPQARMESGSAAQVRFLNAVTEGGSLRITAGNRLLSSSLPPEGLSEYFTVAAGFRSFTFYDADHPWMLLFRSTLPLAAGDVVTLAVIRSGGGGLDLVRVDDRPCGVQGTDLGCIRCVNLVYDSPGLDLVLTDGRVVFTDVRFKEVTNYRRARPGRYDLYAAQTPSSERPDIETVEDLPIPVASWMPEPLASFFLDLRAGGQVSLFLMGDWGVSRELRVKAVENF